MVSVDFLNAEHARALDSSDPPQPEAQGPVAGAPARIWLDPTGIHEGWTGLPEQVLVGDVEYIRADLAHEAANGAAMTEAFAFSSGYEAGERDGKASVTPAHVEAGLNDPIRELLQRHETELRAKGRNPLDYTSQWKQAADTLIALRQSAPMGGAGV